MRVLVVEDEQLLADAIAEGLRQQAIAADVAYDGDDGMDRLAVNEYDWSCSTGTCPRSPAMKSAGGLCCPGAILGC